jgi:hypothetical protein
MLIKQSSFKMQLITSKIIHISTLLIVVVNFLEIILKEIY